MEAHKPLLASLVQTTKAAMAIPDEDGDRVFHDTDPDFMEHTEAQGTRLLALVSKLMEQVEPGAFEGTVDTIKEDPADPAAFEAVTDAGDKLLERVDIVIDQVKAGGNTAQNVVKGELAAGAGAGSSRVMQDSRVRKPQLDFAEAVDNSRAHFVPKITLKVNARVPLPDFSGPGPYDHPYEHELASLEHSEWMLSKNEIASFTSLDAVPFTYVDTEEGLTDLMTHLEDDSVREVAIDLEAHSLRSFQGFVCLMQISTRTHDFIVDTLALRSHLQVLNTVFTDPSVVKVMHGADSDIVWLQRDFGVYIVNLFDTGQAARVLQYPSFGLAHLLEVFCKVTADKQYQLADWRVRPLPTEYIKYAREDTHYLLGIYDRMKNELLDSGSTDEGNLLSSLLARSNDVCAVMYDKPEFTPTSYLTLLSKLHLQPPPTTEQERVFAALYDWRDAVARREDESVFYVINRRALVALTTHMPVNVQQLQRACNPLPALVRANAREVVEVIAKAREATGAPPGAASKTPAPQPPRARAPQLSGAGTLFLPVTPTLKIAGSPSMITPSPDVSRAISPPALTTPQLFASTGWMPQVSEERMAQLQSSRPPTTRKTTVSTAKGSVATRMYSFPTAFDSDLDVGDASTDEEEVLRRHAADGVQASLERVTHGSLLPSVPSDAAVHAPPAAAAGAAVPSTADVAAPRPTQEEFLAVPKSLGEIYSLSNRNRKVNKDKKRAKTAESDGEDDGSAVVRKVEPPTDSHVDFMKKIGWVAPTADPWAVASHADGAGAGNASFDYAAANSRAAGAAEATAAAAPQSTRGRRDSKRRGRGGRGGGGSNPYVTGGQRRGGSVSGGVRVGRGGAIHGAERSTTFRR